MAKNNDLDDFDLDNLDDGMGLFGEPPKNTNGKKRSAILETATTARKSAINTILPPGRRNEIILKGLPDSAGDAYEGFKDAQYAASDIISHTKEELVKTERLLQQQTRAAMPTIKKFLPNSITNKIGKWANKSAVDRENVYDVQQATIDRAMSEVFGAVQAGPVNKNDEIKEQKETEFEETKDRLKETMNVMRQDAMHETLIGVAKDVRDIAGINRGTMVNVARRSLELQYRQLFVLQDLAKIAQSRFDRDTPALEAIVKNTGLPDYAKEEFSEIWKAQAKRRVADFVSPKNFLETFFPRFTEKTNKAISNVGDMSRQLVGALLGGIGDSDFDFEDNSELSPEQRRSNLAQKGVSLATSKIIDKYINPLRDKFLDKSKNYINENMPGLAKNLSKAGYGLYNIGAISNSAAAGQNDSGLGDLLKVGQSLGLVDVYRNEKVGFDVRNATNLNATVGFDRRTWISINEVIPAWLGKINQSIIRSTGIDTPDETYDLTTRQFVKSSVVANRIRKYVANDYGKDRMERNIRVVIDFIDPNKKLSNETRKGLSNFINDAVSNAREVNLVQIVKRPFMLNRYMGTSNIDEFVKLINARSSSFPGGIDEFNLELSKKVRELSNGVTSYQQRFKAMTDQYGEHVTMKAGIVRYNSAKDTMETDKDLFDINTRFRSLESGKLRKGKATDIRDAVDRARDKNSSSWYFLKDRANYMDDVVSNDDTEPMTSSDKLRKALQNASNGNINISGEILSRTLYGETYTNIPELMKTYSDLNLNGRISETDKIVNAINSNNETITSILEHVRSMDEDGIVIDKMEASDSEEGPPTRKWWQLLKKRKDRKEAKAKRKAENASKSKKGIIRRTLGGIGGIWKFGINKGRWARKRIMDSIFNPFKVAADGVRGIKRGITGTIKGVLGIRDIYDEKGNVVLVGSKLKNKEYFQLVNDVLTPLTKLDDIDINKDILDSDGNIIITASDLAAKGKLSYYSTGKWWGLAERLGGTLGSKVPDVLKIPFKLANAVRERSIKRIKALFEYPDMYINGNFDNPVIRADVLKRGGYLLKSTGEVITKPSDITGAVIDRQNNIVISDEDIKKEGFALVDINGKPVKTGLGKIIGRITAPFKWGLKQLGKIPRTIKGIKDSVKNFWPVRKLGEGWDWFKDKAKSIFSGDKVRNAFSTVKTSLGSLGSSKRTNTILMRIYKLLNKRLSGDPEDESWMEDSVTKKLFKGARLKTRFKALKRKLRNRNGMSIKDRIMSRFKDDPNFVGPKKPNMFTSKFNTIKNKITGNKFYKYGKGKTDVGRALFGNAIDKLLGKNSSLKQEVVDLLNNKDGLSWEERQAKAKDIRSRMDSAEYNKHRGIMGSIRRKFFGQRKDEEAFNRGKANGKKKETISEKLSRLLNLQEITWFDRMRRSAREDGMPESGISRLFAKFSRRVKFNKDGEKKDFLRWFKRRKKNGTTDKAKAGKIAKGKKGILGKVVGGIFSTIGGLLSTVLGGGAGLIGDGLGLLARGAVSLLAPVASAVVGGVVSAGSAIVGAVGLPAIAAAVVVGGVAYLAYKYFSKKQTKFLARMRFAQYGIQNYDDYNNDEVAKCLYLESELKKTTAFDEKGGPQVRGVSGDVLTKMAQGLDIDTENKTEMLSFYAWLKQRVIPIYLRWVGALRSMPDTPKLEDVGDTSKVSPDTMLKIYPKVYLDKDAKVFKQLEDPRKADRGLFGKIWDTVTFADTEFLDGEEVVDVSEEVKSSIEREKTFEERNKNASSYYSKYAAGVNETIKSREENAIKVLTEQVNNDKNRLNSIDKYIDSTYMKVAGALSSTESIKLMVEDERADDKSLNSLTSVRMKSYGLTNLDSLKVKAIRKLEDYVLKSINANSGEFKGNIPEAMDVICPGISGESEERRNEVEVWFRYRFINVALTYIMMVKRYFGSTQTPFDVNSRGSWMFAVASVVITTKALRGSQQESIWHIKESPFESMSSNTSKESVTEEMNTLREISTRNDLAVNDLLKSRNKAVGIDIKKVFNSGNNKDTIFTQKQYERDVAAGKYKISDIDKLLDDTASKGSLLDNIKQQANSDLRKGNSTVGDVTINNSPTTSNNTKNISGYANGATVSKYRSGIYSAPVVDPLITSPYGPRNVKDGSSYHRGIDLRGAYGDPIFAVCSGKIDECGGDYNQIGLLHEDGYRTRYLHCSRILVKKGDVVKVGQKIALVGGKGPKGVQQYNSHLHFEVISNDGVKLDPEVWLNNIGIPTPHKGSSSRLNEIRIAKALANAKPFIGLQEAGSGVKDDPNANLPDSPIDTTVKPVISSANAEDVALTNIVDRADAIDTKSKLDSNDLVNTNNNLKAASPTSDTPETNNQAVDKLALDKAANAASNKADVNGNMTEAEKEIYKDKVKNNVAVNNNKTKAKAEKDLSASTIPNYDNALSNILSVNIESRDHLGMLVKLVTTIANSRGNSNVAMSSNVNAQQSRYNPNLLKSPVLDNSRNKNI